MGKPHHETVLQSTPPSADVNVEADADDVEGFISPLGLFYIDIYFTGIGLSLLYAFAIACNIINIIVFWKQGLKDSATLTFFALAISDLGSLLVQFVQSVSTIPAVLYPDSPVDIFAAQRVITIWPRYMFTAISMLVTVYMTVERSLTVLFPLKFKQIVIYERTLKIITSIYLFVIAMFVPVYCTQGLHWESYGNTTILARWVSEDYYYTVERYLDIVCNVTITTASEVIVIVATFILIRGLKRASKTRQKLMSNQTEAEVGSSARETNLMNMVFLLALVFVICNSPLVVTVIAILTVPDFNLGGRYENTLILVENVVVMAYGINASCNVFIYYRLSSRFRAIIKDLFPFYFRQEKAIHD